MKNFLLFLLLLCFFNLNAQNIISGKVIDKKTKDGLPGISVYINSSTLGTVTDVDGKFTLNVPFSGKVELVASHIAFQKRVVLVDVTNKESLLISLEQQNHSLNEVVIKSRKNKDDNFNKWGDLFTQIIMGNNSQFANKSKILNPESLVFYFDKENNELSVYAKSQLLIENELMAYRIKLDLENFKYAFNTDVLEINYSKFFEDLPMDKNKKSDANEWRLAAYYGSQMHFMRSVYQNNLTRDGFTLYAYRTIKNQEKLRISKIIQTKIGQRFAIKNSPSYDIKSLFQDKDTANYYQLVMKQDDNIALDTTKVSLRKLATLERELGIVKFNFTDTLMIKYNPNMLLKQHVSLVNNIDSKKSKDMKQNLAQHTFMYLVEEGGINIQDNGYYPDMILFIYGNMSERRMSQLLPWDYDPNKINML